MPEKDKEIEVGGEPIITGRSASVFQGGPITASDFSSDDARLAYEEMLEIELRLTPAGG